MLHRAKEIQFEGFRFRPEEKCLFRDGLRIRLTGKEIEILATLLEEPGRVIKKQLLGALLWPGVEMDESNLFHHLSSLRRKLKEAGGDKVYIETVPGVGYRFLCQVSTDDVEVGKCLSESPAAENTPEHTPGLQKPLLGDDLLDPVSETTVRRLVSGNRLIVLAVAVVTFAAVSRLFYERGPGRQPPTRVTADASRNGALLSPKAEIQTAPENIQFLRIIASISVGLEPSNALLIPAKNELYVSEAKSDAVSVINVSINRVTSHIAVGHQPTKLAIGPDHGYILLAQQNGVGIIDTATKAYSLLDVFKGQVDDIAIMPDGASAYLALGFGGLAKLDLRTKVIKIVSTDVYARALALTRGGTKLYVSYQAGGPDGSAGHDAIGYFDTSVDRLAGTIKGFPNVGECLTVSPDNSQVWENGEDACDSPQYDHAGCPTVPAGLLNIIDVTTNRHLRSVAVRGARLQCVTFSPDGALAALGSTNQLMFLRSADHALMGSLPIDSPGNLAFSPDGSVAYSPLTNGSAVAVIEIGRLMKVIRLTNHEAPDGSMPLAILSDAQLDAKLIDPSSLRLGGKSVSRTQSGPASASIEHVAGFDGHGLIVHFNMENRKATARMAITGRTYGGVPVHGIVNFQ